MTELPPSALRADPSPLHPPCSAPGLAPICLAQSAANGPRMPRSVRHATR